HSLIVANSGSVGLGCLATMRLERLAAMADFTATSSAEALGANTNAFAEQSLAARPHPGQVVSGKRVWALMAGGALAEGIVVPSSLQDPLSIRTIPQVHGALLEQLAHLNDTLNIELNSMPENPFIDRKTQEMTPNGNFSTIRLALALESTRLSLGHLAMLAERRIASMVRQLRSNRGILEQIEALDYGSYPLIPVINANTASALVARIQ